MHPFVMLNHVPFSSKPPAIASAILFWALVLLVWLVIVVELMHLTSMALQTSLVAKWPNSAGGASKWTRMLSHMAPANSLYQRCLQVVFGRDLTQNQIFFEMGEGRHMSRNNK